jgi:hypothetical protein
MAELGRAAQGNAMTEDAAEAGQLALVDARMAATAVALQKVEEQINAAGGDREIVLCLRAKEAQLHEENLLHLKERLLWLERETGVCVGVLARPTRLVCSERPDACVPAPRASALRAAGARVRTQAAEADAAAAALAALRVTVRESPSSFAKPKTWATYHVCAPRG